MRSLHLFILLLCTAFAPSVFGQNTQRSIPFFSVLQPAALYAQYEYQSTVSSAPYTTGLFGANVENEIVRGPLAVSSTDSMLNMFCEPSAVNLTGKIALIRRGTCEFGRKALHAQNQGAIGAIIINHTLNGADLIVMAPGAFGDSVTIPAIMVRQALGNALFDAIVQGQVVEVAFSSSPVGFALLEGDVRRDANTNCIAEPGEQALKYWMVQAEGVSGGVTASLTATVYTQVH
jgi:hypothetical protein